VAITITSALPCTLRANDVIQIVGTGFGAVKGKVTINGVKAPCAPWTDTAIQCYVPMGVPGGGGNFVVTHADGVTTGSAPMTHQGQRAPHDTSATPVKDRDHD